MIYVDCSCHPMGCVRCGECCRRLYWSDRIRVSFFTRTLCPDFCRNWMCGAWQIPKHIKITSLPDLL
ncbi:MAG: hypothetical protein ABH879_00515 [archaeon]